MIYLNNAATSWPKPSSVCEAVEGVSYGHACFAIPGEEAQF